jgi:tetratricopeptide (TPR) repeat protein
MISYEEQCQRCFRGTTEVSPEEQIEARGAIVAADRSRDDVERALHTRGLLRVDFQGDLDGAIEDYGRAIALTPKAEYFQCRGEALSGRGRGDEALADFARVTELDPGRALAHLSAGGIHLGRGDPRQALLCFDRALEINPDWATAYYSRHLAQADLGAWEEAARDLDRAIDCDPADPVYRGVRAARALRQGDAARALLDLDRALESAPDLAGLLYLRGVARRRAGDDVGAAADLAEARRLSPDIDREMEANGFPP